MTTGARSPSTFHLYTGMCALDPPEAFVLIRSLARPLFDVAAFAGKIIVRSGTDHACVWGGMRDDRARVRFGLFAWVVSTTAQQEGNQ